MKISHVQGNEHRGGGLTHPEGAKVRVENWCESSTEKMSSSGRDETQEGVRRGWTKLATEGDRLLTQSILRRRGGGETERRCAEERRTTHFRRNSGGKKAEETAVNLKSARSNRRLLYGRGKVKEAGSDPRENLWGLGAKADDVRTGSGDAAPGGCDGFLLNC